MPSALRRGLPRTRDGEPWPPAGAAPAFTDVPDIQNLDVPVSDAAEAQIAATESARAEPVATQLRQNAGVSAADSHSGATERAAEGAATIRRGLPWTPAGDPWPPASLAVAPAHPRHSAGASAADPQGAATRPPLAEPVAAQQRQIADARAADPQSGATEPVAEGAAPTRRGLPRTSAGEPWPPAGTVPASRATNERALQEVPQREPQSTARAEDARASLAAVQIPDVDPQIQSALVPAVPTVPAVAAGPRAPLTVPKSVWVGRAASHRPARKSDPAKIGAFTKAQWVGVVIVGGGGLLFAAALAVVFVRAFLSLEFMQDFLTTYPGEYHLPEGAPVGIPAWLGWQHFFNVFLMVLIIRSGLTIRTEKRPTAFWTPRRDPKGKTSLTIWFHQALDIFWLLNGVIFVILLFVTGQWMRIIPTSWEVFPNALSAALQYVSLDWPTENGWVNYNALQQIAYFSTVFLAAPLAAITGYRMSGLWPKNNARLNAAYPIEWARKVHFPVMLYFVVFIFIHVALVLATGALRNLNHMYASLGSVDGVAYAENWTGFWMFFASLVVIAAAWIAARPLVLAPIARLFGTVSGR